MGEPAGSQVMFGLARSWISKLEKRPWIKSVVMMRPPILGFGGQRTQSFELG